MRNLALGHWGLWAGPEERTLLDALDEADWRCLVLDTGALASPAERAVTVQALLARLWECRRARQPVLLVVDEAHNVCPQAPEDPLTAMAGDLGVRIAGEGRKFGLYLLAVSQRPDKLHPNVLSQCDNLVLMRMNSSSDIAQLRVLFSQVPATLLEQATRFRLGEALVAGRICAGPTFVRVGARLTVEGGADVPATWAALER